MNKEDQELMDLLYEEERIRGVYYENPTEDLAFQEIFMKDYRDALEDLPEELRIIMEKYYDENGEHSFTAKEISSETGLKPSQVYTKKIRLLKYCQTMPN